MPSGLFFSATHGTYKNCLVARVQREMATAQQPQQPQQPQQQQQQLPASPIIKNLLIKDASGNTQLIEVIQTGPGKFMTASGHSIKTSIGVGGGRTIIRAGSIAGQQQQQQQNLQLQPITASVSTLSVSQSGQIIRTNPQQIITTSTSGTPSTTTTILNGTTARQVMTTIPIQPAQSNTPVGSTLIKPANIKTEFGTTTTNTNTGPGQGQQTTIQRSTGQTTILTSNMQQVLQSGSGQRLLLTQTPNGPQLTPISLSQISGGQQILTFSNASGPLSPANNIGPTLNLSKQFISPILDHTGATRKRVDFQSDVSYESKRRKAEKGGKGLRHFSMKVCEKVRTKGLTTYNEVADELVQEFASPAMGLSSIEQQFDQKNIRRRVYDALNVLMAMNIISKEKKEIKWLGLPTNSMQECTTLEKDRQKRIERLKSKTQQLHDLIIQQVAFKSLVERNKEREKESGPPPPHGSIHLPFLIVNTAKQTVIDCSISNDKMEYLFNFDGTFEIHDDIEVLKRMGLSLGLDKGECTDENILRAKQVLPKALEMYIDQLGKRDEDWRAEFGDLDFEECYFEADALDNSENVMFEMTGNSGLTLSSGVEEMSMNMSVEDLEMEAAIESLHNNPIEDGMDGPDDEDSYGEDEDEVEGGMSD